MKAVILAVSLFLLLCFSVASAQLTKMTVGYSAISGGNIDRDFLSFDNECPYISIRNGKSFGQKTDFSFRLTRKQGESRSRTRILVESACYKNVITPVQAKGPAILSLPKWFVQGADNEF